MTDILYKTKATVTGGRSGLATLSDNPTQLTLHLPKELGGAGADKGLNPEQLFAIGYSSCFEAACTFVAKRDNIPFAPKYVSAEVSLLKREGGFSIAVNMFVKYDSAVNQDEATSLTNKAHLVCPYSYATMNNIEVKLWNCFEPE